MQNQATRQRGQDIVFQPEALATAFYGRIPAFKVGQQDAVRRRDGATLVSRLDKVEAVAVAHHASLRRRRRRNAVPTARCSSRFRYCRRQSGARSNDTNTEIPMYSPKAPCIATQWPDSRLPTARAKRRRWT